MSWKKVRLDSICTMLSGNAWSASKFKDSGKIPIIRIQNLGNNENEKFIWWDDKYDNKFVIHAGDLLLSLSGSIKIDTWKGEDALLNQRIVKLIPNNGVDHRWFYWQINNIILEIEKMGKWALVNNVSVTDLKDLQIPLPPLPIQKRIAEILDAADALRRKDQELLSKYDELAQAIFIDMFGDPVKNEKGWEVKKMSDILDKIESGWSPNCLNRSASLDEWGVLKLGSVTKCIFDDKENKALPKEELARETLEVKEGDLLFSRKNTSNLVAACVLVKKTRPKLMMSDLIFRLKINKTSDIQPVYLQSLLVYPTKRAFIQSLAGGAAGSMPNISKEKLMSVEIELPPIEIQSFFAKKLHIIEAQKELIIASNSGRLFDSLLQQAFKGELVK